MTKHIKPKRRLVNCRKIYESYHGPIPIDEFGRTYDIHHIDGNHTNNDISNLKAVTIQEHYDIHYSQGDWAACQLIGLRMKLSPEEISKLASNSNKSRLRTGNHHFGNSEWQKNNQLNRVENGTHPWKGGDFHRKLVAEGKHHWLGGVPHKRLVAEGRHHFLGSDSNQARLNNGTHPSQVIRTCPHCGFTGRGGVMKKWHFDNCRTINRAPTNMKECPHCGKKGTSGAMFRWHFDNCKKKQPI